MSAPFKGVWASFAEMDAAVAVIDDLRREGRDFSVLSPFYHHDLHTAVGSPVSWVPWVTLVFGALGVFFGFAMTSWTALDWVLPVSSKPIVSLPPYSIFAFELMVLLGGVFTAVGILGFGFLDLQRRKLPRSAHFKQYGRFSRDRFGVVVRCEESETEQVSKIMRDHGAEEVVRED